MNLQSFKKGFTLIELLIVIAIMGVIASAVLVAIDPVDKINSANDSKIQADIAQIAGAGTAFATSNNGFYSPDTATLKTQGELSNIPTPPGGGAYSYVASPNLCTTATCTSFVITQPLKSKKYAGYPTWRFDSATGVACAYNAAASPVCKP